MICEIILMQRWGDENGICVAKEGKRVQWQSICMSWMWKNG